MTKRRLIITFLVIFAPGTTLAADLPADCSAAQAPTQPLEASIGGTKYAPEFVKLIKSGAMKSDDEAFDTYRLTLRNVDNLMAPLDMEVTVIVPQGKSIDGKVFRRLPTKSISKQHMASKTSGLPEIQGWSYADRKAGTRGSHVAYVASLRLEFGERQGETIPGTIFLCVPKGQTSFFDKTPTAEDSYAIGAFEALVQ